MFSFKKTYLLPFKYEIPNYTNNFLLQNSLVKRYFKYIKRVFFIAVMGQKNLEILKIDHSKKNILWINFSAPSLGDSLMDLSSRVLLQGRRVDLFTNASNAAIYSDDLYISNIFTNKKSVNQNTYDLVIVDSFSSRSIRIKKNIAPSVPFVSMFGYYNGPEVNRVLFSFHRMNQLLGYINNENIICQIAKCSLFVSRDDQKIVKDENLPEKYISIAVGGEWAYRSYEKWDCLIEKIFSDSNRLNIVIVGSKNGSSCAEFLMKKFTGFNIYNCVSRFTFNQTAQIIKQANFLICCDGGLMHAANAVNTPIVPLFAKLSEQMQLTDSVRSFPLSDKEDVNNILVESIKEKYIEANNLIKT